MRTLRFVHTGLLVLTTVLTQSLPAFGQPPSGAPSAQQPPAGGAVKTADEYVNEGREFAENGDDQRAYEAYQAAWKLKKSYDIAGNLGTLELMIGKARDAAEHLAFSERHYPAGREASQREGLARIQEALMLARAKVGLARIRVAPHDGLSAEGAEIAVDGKPVGRASASGKLVHSLLQSSEIFVDAGRRTFTAHMPGCEEGRAVVSFTKGSAVDVVLSPCQRRLAVLPIVVGSTLAVAGIGLGIRSAISSNARSRDADAISVELAKQNDQRACNKDVNARLCDALNDAHDSSQIWRGLAIGSFLLGGAAAAATVIYVVTGQSTPPPGLRAGVEVQASFSPVPGGGAAVLRGTF